MEDQNKLASEWYQITYSELANMMNQHYQISQANPFHSGLPELAMRIRRVAACCDLWKRVSMSNELRKFYYGE